MPITYHIEREENWLEVKLSGPVSIRETCDFHRQIYADPAYSDDFNGIIDCREMTNVLTVNELRDVADLQLARPGPSWRSRRALLVASPAQYSTARVFMVFAESSPIQYGIFYNLETARRWVQE